MTPAAPATRSEKGNRKSRLGERDRKKGEGGRHEDPILSDVQSSGEGGAEKAKKGGRKRVKQAEKFIDHGHLTQFDYLYTVEREGRYCHAFLSSFNSWHWQTSKWR